MTYQQNVFQAMDEAKALLDASVVAIQALKAENAELRESLAYAIELADGWHDGPIDGDERFDKARALLRTGPEPDTM